MELIDSVAVMVQGTKLPNANRKTHVSTQDYIKYRAPVMDLADMLPWMCPNATGLAAHAPKEAFHNDASYWHNIGAVLEV